MTQYYFLSSFLPIRQFNDPLIYSYDALDDLLSLNLSTKDWKNYLVLKRFFDLENFASFWANKPIVFHLGEVTQKNVQELVYLQQWADSSEFEDFFKDFLFLNETNEERLENFSILVKDFLSFYQQSSSVFLQSYFTFKQQLRVVLAGIRARFMQMDVAYVLRNEDASDAVVLQVLMQKDAPRYELPDAFADLGNILEDYGHLPYSLYRSLSLYEFHKIEEMARNSSFDSNVVLARVVLYLLAIRHSSMNVEKGTQIINSMEKEITW